jgi:NCS2 family nucleobase:cation symporter-2
MKKPADLVFGVDEHPPTADSVVVAVQHVGAIAVNFIYPLLLARQAGLSTETAGHMLSIGMAALAIGVLLQAIPRGPIGCHYLAPMVYASPYLAPGFLAIEMGGMPLFWGMTIVAGLATLVFASIWDRLRTFVPPESAGLVVFLVGATIGLAALRLVHKDDGTVGGAEGWVTLLTLAVMIALNVWTKGRLRLFCVLVGIVAGYLIALATGVLTTDKLVALASLPIFALPRFEHLAWSFDAALIVPFVITALAVAMATTAIVTTYQRITDAEWARPDMRTISGGMRGDGLSTILAGMLGHWYRQPNCRLSDRGYSSLGGGTAGVRRSADDHARASDGGWAALPGRLHYDQRRADHIDACDRRATHACHRNGNLDISPGRNVPAHLCRRPVLAATNRELAARACHDCRAHAEFALSHRHKTLGRDADRHALPPN